MLQAGFAPQPFLPVHGPGKARGSIKQKVQAPGARSGRVAHATVRLVGFVLALVGGVLGLVGALRPVIRFGARDIGFDLMLLLAGGAVALVGALRSRQGGERDGGVLAVVGGVLMLVANDELSGVLALVGGVLFLVD